MKYAKRFCVDNFEYTRLDVAALGQGEPLPLIAW